jgi:hypothetical protein
MKLALARALNMVLQPVRDHFRNNAEAKKPVKEIFKCYVKAGPKLIGRDDAITQECLFNKSRNICLTSHGIILGH